jgi:hypothetical protein
MEDRMSKSSGSRWPQNVASVLRTIGLVIDVAAKAYRLLQLIIRI